MKEGRDNGKRSSRKRETKDQKGLLRPKRRERERVLFADSQLYHTSLELMGNGSPFSASDPFASVCTQFSQMESGDVQLTRKASKDKT